ncbi:MAG: hypothetical protein Q7T03_04425 [Deltaproteobacteria bacterium]|nr:hypothetical protein [Deltaproteobacteria bacterium]
MAQEPVKTASNGGSDLLTRLLQELDSKWDLDPRGKKLIRSVIMNGTSSPEDRARLKAWIGAKKLKDIKSLSSFEPFGASDSDHVVWFQKVEGALSLRDKYLEALKKTEWVLKLVDYGIDEGELSEFFKSRTALKESVDILQEVTHSVIAETDPDFTSFDALVFRAQIRSLGVILEQGESNVSGARRYLASIGFENPEELSEVRVSDLIGYTFSGKQKTFTLSEKNLGERRTFFLSPKILTAETASGPLLKTWGPFEKGCHSFDFDFDQDEVKDQLEFCIDQEQAGAPYLANSLHFTDGRTHERQLLLQMERDFMSPCAGVCTVSALDVKKDKDIDLVVNGETVFENRGSVWSDPAYLSLQILFIFPNSAQKHFGNFIDLTQQGAGGGGRLVLEDFKDFAFDDFRLDLGVAVSVFKPSFVYSYQKGSQTINQTTEGDLQRTTEHSTDVIQVANFNYLPSGAFSLTQHFRWKGIPNLFLSTEAGLEYQPGIVLVHDQATVTENRGALQKDLPQYASDTVELKHAVNGLFGFGLGYALPLGDVHRGFQSWMATAGLSLYLQTPSLGSAEEDQLSSGVMGPVFYLGIGRSL